MIKIKNPNNGKIITHESTSLSETRKKIEHLKSNTTWAKLSIKKRTSYLNKFKKQLEKNKEKLQHILSLETGKPAWESATEITSAINKLESTLTAYQYRCHYPTRTIGNKKIQTVSKPLGLIGIIGPFNFPIHIPNGQIIPALLTGNTAILKCSEYAIRTTKEIESYWKQAFNNIDLPIDFVYGNETIGKALVKHQDINAIFFTGSSVVGTNIEKECMKQRKPCALEMGGNNAIIIEDKLPNIMEHLTMSAFITAGQRCTCARRIIINKKHASIIPKWVEQIKKLTISPYPSNIDSFMGPVVLENIKETILRRKTQTSETLLTAKDIGPGGLITPRIELTNNNNDEEIFGPMVFIELVDSIDAAIDRVNQSQYGLSTSIYTSSKKKFTHAFQCINTGIINWNTPTTGASGLAPFGGTKLSGNHKPGGFNMIDHCIIPTASNELSVPNKIILPGTDA